ncbi:MAG: sulfite exporter TauE/SafE family protein [Anaerolineales bacterium]|nr:MAG: sulfite exporter TauE/SafE family protein [Anaerolineales bacterium]
MHSLAIFSIITLAVFTQSVTGFGVALVAMALLPAILGLQVAVPLVALVALSLETLLLFRYRRSVQFRTVLPLALGALGGIPLGILVLRSLNERLVLSVLGLVIAAYSIYSLIEVNPPRMSQPAWPYAFGFLAGMLGGAYNVSGPPVVVYGTSARWPPQQFKGNLQGFFIFSSLAVAISHAFSGNFSGQVLREFPLALGAVGMGFVMGASLDRYMNPLYFRKAVLLMLLVMGVKLTFFG